VKTLEEIEAEERAALNVTSSGSPVGAASPGAPAAPPTPEDQAKAAAVTRTAGEIAGLLDSLLAVFGAALPSVKAIYTPEVIQAASGAVARVCVKRGWLTDGMGQYSEEISCALIVVPLAVQTVQAVKKDLPALTKPAEPKGAQPAAAGAKVDPLTGQPLA
jgi:hypothetical protein